MTSDAPGAPQPLAPHLRILVWSPTGFGEHYNGPANSMKRLFARIAARHPITVTVMHASARQGPMPDFVAETVFFGLSDPRPDQRLRSAVETIAFLARAGVWLVRNHRRFDAAVFATPSIHCLIPGLIARVLRLKAIGRIAAAEGELYDTSSYKALLRWSRLRAMLLARLDGVIALSDEIAARLAELGLSQAKIIRLPNGADCDRFTPATARERAALREKLGLHPDVFTLVCAGKIGDRKGQMVAIEAIANMPGVQLLLAGPFEDGATEATFRDAVSRLGLADHVRFTGQIARVEDAYRASDAFILLSKSEGMPNAMVEAMACGLAIIGTRVSGVPELVGEGERGVLVERDVTAVTEAVRQFAANPEATAALGAAGRDFIVAHQNSDQIADRLVALLQPSRRTSQDLQQRETTTIHK